MTDERDLPAGMKKHSAETEKVLAKLDEMQADAAPPKESSAARTGKENPNPVKAAERSVAADAPMATRAADIAAGMMSGARAQIEAAEQADARIKSDPRYERDQKIFEMGQRGELAAVPPSEATAAALAGAPASEVAAKLPKTAEEQAADDEKRLAEGEQKAKEPRATVIKPGEHERQAAEAAEKKAAEERTKSPEEEPPKDFVIK